MEQFHLPILLKKKNLASEQMSRNRNSPIPFGSINGHMTKRYNIDKHLLILHLDLRLVSGDLSTDKDNRDL